MPNRRPREQTGRLVESPVGDLCNLELEVTDQPGGRDLVVSEPEGGAIVSHNSPPSPWLRPPSRV